MNQKEPIKKFMMISRWKKPFGCDVFFYKLIQRFNPFNPEFTIVINIHYKPWIAAAIFDS